MPDELDISNPYNTLETDYGPVQELPQPTQSQKQKPALNAAVVVLRVSIIFIIGLAILAGIDSSVSRIENNGLTLKFTANPVDGDTFQVDNNVFEFDDGNGVVSGNIPIQIGDTVQETSDNTMAVLNQYSYNVVIAV